MTSTGNYVRNIINNLIFFIRLVFNNLTFMYTQRIYEKNTLENQNNT